MQFNTLPSNNVVAGVAGAANIFPTLTPLPIGITAGFRNMESTINLEGFAGDGDYIELPSTNTDTLDYFDAAGSVQWTTARTDLGAAVDNWMGFTLDATDDLIYMVGVDTATSPNTYFLSNVNQAGTVVNIGNAQPAGDFTPASPAWNTAPGTDGSSLIQRVADGAGNMLVTVRNNTGGVEQLVMDITNGTIVSDPTPVTSDGNTPDVGYKTNSGVYISWTVTTSNLRVVRINDADRSYPGIKLFEANAGIPQGFTLHVKIIPWKGYVASAGTASGFDAFGPKSWAIDEMNRFAQALRGLFV